MPSQAVHDFYTNLKEAVAIKQIKTAKQADLYIDATGFSERDRKALKAAIRKHLEKQPKPSLTKKQRRNLHSALAQKMLLRALKSVPAERGRLGRPVNILPGIPEGNENAGENAYTRPPSLALPPESIALTSPVYQAMVAEMNPGEIVDMINKDSSLSKTRKEELIRAVIYYYTHTELGRMRNAEALAAAVSPAKSPAKHRSKVPTQAELEKMLLELIARRQATAEAFREVSPTRKSKSPPKSWWGRLTRALTKKARAAGPR